MAKSIIKEIIIMLLLCIAILLILGILFYDYIPMNKVIPTKEAYETPENVKQEISEQVTEIEKTEVSYEITDADLNIYKQSKSYVAGKKDPFSLETSTEKNNATEGSNANNPVSGENDNKGSSDEEVQNTETKDKNSTGTFFNDDGVK